MFTKAFPDAAAPLRGAFGLRNRDMFAADASMGQGRTKLPRPCKFCNLLPEHGIYDMMVPSYVRS